MVEARSDAPSRINGAITSTSGSASIDPVQEALKKLPGTKRQHQADPDADGRCAAALSQHLSHQGAWLCADRDSNAELARAPRDDVRLDAVDAEHRQEQRDAAEHREHRRAGSIEPHLETVVEVIAAMSQR